MAEKSAPPTPTIIIDIGKVAAATMASLIRFGQIRRSGSGSDEAIFWYPDLILSFFEIIIHLELFHPFRIQIIPDCFGSSKFRPPIATKFFDKNAGTPPICCGRLAPVSIVQIPLKHRKINFVQHIPLQLLIIDRDVFTIWLAKAFEHFSSIVNLIYLEP
uniref:Uncharacterized protein n=1 Tax=Romanomermis culicivorax TaxID=13658 RepID=A0A915KCS9_ROMCU